MINVGTSFDPVTMMAGAAFFAILWAASALHKVLQWHSYRDQLRDYQVLPESVLPLLAPLLVAGEAVIALAWLTPSLQQLAAVAGALLLATYAAAMGYNLAHGRDSIDCGCGGDGQLIRWGLVVRNLVLMSVSLLPLWLADTDNAGGRALSWLDFITVAAAALVMYGAYIVANQLLANNPPQRSAR